MTQNTKLKKCPFCGSSVTARTMSSAADKIRFFYCSGEVCGAVVSFRSMSEKSTSKWNRRKK